MATNVKLPPGFVLDKKNESAIANIPEGFVLDQGSLAEAGIGAGKATGIRQSPPAWKEYIGLASRIGLPSIGSGVGASAGAWAGVPGIAAGGILGYMGGSNLADAIEQAIGLRAPAGAQEVISRQPQYLVEGVVGEAIGPATGMAIRAPKALFKAAEKKAFGKYPSLVGFKDKMPSLSQEKIMERAGDKLIATETGGEPYASNIAEATKLEQKIPGLKFTRAQKSQDPLSIMQERALPRSYPKAVDVWKKQRAQANESIRNYYKEKFPESEGVDEFLAGIQEKQATVSAKAEVTKGLREAELGKIQPKMGEQIVGQTIRGEAAAGKKSMYGTVEELYKAVPKTKIQGAPIAEEIGKLKSEFVQSGDAPASFPSQLIKQMEQALDPDAALKSSMGPEDFALLQQNPKMRAAVAKGMGLKESEGVDFQQLRGFQTQIWQAQKDAERAGNYQLSRRLTDLGKTVGETIESQLKTKGEEYWNPYQTAKEAFKKYDVTYRRGAVGDILERGDLPNGKKIADMDVAGQFFRSGRLDEADQFISALGGNESSRSAMKDYASHDLIRATTNPTTGEIDSKRLSRWLFQNKSVLRRFNLEKEYVGLAQAQKAVDMATKDAAIFEKSNLARILNADPDKVMNVLFSGKGGIESARQAQDLLKLTADNPSARRGLKRAFADSLYSQMERTELDIMQNPEVSVASATKLMKKYGPAIRELYRDEPQKLQAMLDVQAAYKTLQRNVSSPLGGGSDTAENLFTALTQETAPLVMTRYRWVSAFKAVAQRLDKYTKDQQNAYLTRAMVDDEIAETLRDAAKGAFKSEKQLKLLDKKVENQMRRMILFGGYGTGKAYSDLQERREPPIGD